MKYSSTLSINSLAHGIGTAIALFLGAAIVRLGWEFGEWILGKL